MAWRPGARIGQFQLQAKLGEGGMGAVFQARDLGTGAEVALKTLAVQATPLSAERFRREAQAMAALGPHPNLVAVHSSGTEQGALYLVMDLVRGGDLAQRLAQGPLPPTEAAELVRQLALGLALAHSKGVVHRDLKPHNVLFDEAGVPKLADFGLARIEGEQRLTRTGELLGTPAYMAPEQVDGQGVDARSDVYGLGAILYHCLSGSPPYSGTVFEIVTKVVKHAPPPLPRHVPPGLRQACEQAMAKDPARRPADAGELAELLAESGAPAPAFAGRWPLALLIFTACLAGGLALASLLAGPARQTPTASLPSPPPPPTPPPPSESPAPRPAPEPEPEPEPLDDPALWQKFLETLPKVPKTPDDVPSHVTKHRGTWEQATEVSWTAAYLGEVLLNEGTDEFADWGRAWLLAAAEHETEPVHQSYQQLANSFRREEAGNLSPFDDTELARLAFLCRKRAAEAGHVSAFYSYGHDLTLGLPGLPFRPREGVRWLRRALLESEVSDLRYHCSADLARIALHLGEVSELTLEEGLAMGQQALRLREDSPAARYLVGMLLAKLGRVDQALPILEGAAERVRLLVEDGFDRVPIPYEDEAAYTLAVLLEEGRGGLPADPDRARELRELCRKLDYPRQGREDHR